MHEHPHLHVINGGEQTADVRTGPFGVRTQDRLAYKAWADRAPNDPKHLERFTAAYCGAYASKEAWALELVVSLEVAPKLNAAVPEWFRQYVDINLAALAEDMERIGEVAILPNSSGGVWVFDVRAK